jgi:hypothetical protein
LCRSEPKKTFHRYQFALRVALSELRVRKKATPGKQQFFAGRGSTGMPPSSCIACEDKEEET